MVTWTTWISILQWILLIPVIVGSAYAVLCTLALLSFRRQPPLGPDSRPVLPPATILKPVCGLEKNLEENLRSACTQDYPRYQVVFSVRDEADPALPVLRKIEAEFPQTASVHVEDRRAGPNRKVNNLAGALSRARNSILVISDSDVHLRPDYLKKIVAPLADPAVGFVCTLYKAVSARRWFERVEALTLNIDFIPGVVFAYRTGASPFCLGASVAFRRRDLAEAGGMESLAGYLAEDYELGVRLRALGKSMILANEVVETEVDLGAPSDWWTHQVTWDQKTRAARPFAFAATILVRAVPFAILFAFFRGDAAAIGTLGSALAIRWLTAGCIMVRGFGDRLEVRDLILLPLRDMAALVSWGVALLKRRVIWRGACFSLKRGGILREVS